MKKRTWLLTFVTILGLAACGGNGGSGGGDGGIPTAVNQPITPPPTTPVTITTAGGTTSPANQSIAANAFMASQGAVTSGNTASTLAELGLVGVVADNSGTQANRATLADIVRRHAEKLKDHQRSVTGLVQVATQACSGGGTITVAFNDANNSATEVFVNCNEGGVVMHGTIASSGVGITPSLGSTVGSDYSITVTAGFSIDLSIATTAPASTFVTQSSFNFTVKFSGKMRAAAAGGVEPDAPTQVRLTMNGASILASMGTIRELVSNFTIIVDKDNAAGSTTVSGGYTYASTAIGGAVTVNVSPALLIQPQDAEHPISGAVTITSTGSPGSSIVLTVISSPVVGVRVDATNGSVTETANLTWAQVDAL